MKKLYKISLISIAFLLVMSLATSFSYGVWLSDQDTKDTLSYSNDCLSVIFSNDNKIVLNKPLSISDDDGYGSLAYPFALENNCGQEKEIELRLDTLEGSTIEPNKLKVFVNGDISLEPTILDTLPIAKTYNATSIASNLVVRFKISANQILRGNIRMWLSKEAALTPDKEDFIGMMQFTSEETQIKPTFKEILLAKEGLDTINNKGMINFQDIEINDTGLHLANDTEGISYYYRGNVSNNFVSFANKIWRIIRINGNGSIRMIMQDNIDMASFNTLTNDEKYTGYIYTNGEETIDSNAKAILDKWYEENIKKQDLEKYLVTEYYCNDSSVFNVEGDRINYQEFGNLFLNNTPDLKCGKTDKTYGGNYRLKVGLITASETVLAGTTLNKANNSYYLYNGTTFMTMSPIDFYKGQSYIGIVLNNGAFNNAPVNEKRGIRPVINLSASTTVTGSGTIEDPYNIELD